MKVILENLGVLKHAEFELGDLTIICGKNNSGKTYATHALHGFLHGWRNLLGGVLLDEPLDKLLEDIRKDGFGEINIQEYAEKYMQANLKRACRTYNRGLPRVLAASRKNFINNNFEIHLGEVQNILKQKFDRIITTMGSRAFIQVIKESDSPILKILSLREDKDGSDKRRNHKIHLFAEIEWGVRSALLDILYSRYFPNAFIISPERTGAALFKNELDLARNRIVEQLGSDGEDINRFSVLEKNASRYPLPVRENVDYVRRLKDELEEESFLVKAHPNILKDFKKIVGGKYDIDKISNEPIFIPHKSKVKLAMGASSSSVRTLLMLDVYLYHTVQKGDLLIIDEPELSLHPENQRRMARLLARLVNAGIKVFITTHSDYIIRELNNLIKMDKNDLDVIKEIEIEQEYKADELLRLSSEKKGGKDIKAYIAEEGLVQEKGKKRKVKRQILKNVEITKNDGMALDTFDKTIDKINRIQDKIDWG